MYQYFSIRLQGYKESGRYTGKINCEKYFKNVDEPIKVYRVLLPDNEFEIPDIDYQKIEKTNQRLNYYLIIGVTAAILIIILILKYIPNSDKVEELFNKMKLKFPQTTQYPYAAYNFGLLRCQQNWSEIAAIVDEYWDDWGKKMNSDHVFMAYLYVDNADKADQILRNIRTDKVRNLTSEALLYAEKGNREAVMDIIDSFQSEEYVPEVFYASIYAALKDKELMYDHLEKALEKREFLLHMIPSSFSVFYPYRKEARMKEIWAKSWIPIYYDTGEL